MLTEEGMQILNGIEPKRLNVGCGRNVLDGWLNLDSVAIEGVNVVFDLETSRTAKIPLPDDSIDEFLMSHVIEHIRDSLAVMEELYRIAKPGAICQIRVPYGSSDDAWEDPTHVRPYFRGSFGYYSQPYYWRADYGYRADWQTQNLTLIAKKSIYDALGHADFERELTHGRNTVLEMIALLQAVKPARPPLKELQVAPKMSVSLI